MRNRVLIYTNRKVYILYRHCYNIHRCMTETVYYNAICTFFNSFFMNYPWSRVDIWIIGTLVFIVEVFEMSKIPTDRAVIISLTVSSHQYNETGTSCYYIASKWLKLVFAVITRNITFWFLLFNKMSSLKNIEKTDSLFYSNLAHVAIT